MSPTIPPLVPQPGTSAASMNNNPAAMAPAPPVDLTQLMLSMKGSIDALTMRMSTLETQQAQQPQQQVLQRHQFSTPISHGQVRSRAEFEDSEYMEDDDCQVVNEPGWHTLAPTTNSLPAMYSSSAASTSTSGSQNHNQNPGTHSSGRGSGATRYPRKQGRGRGQTNGGHQQQGGQRSRQAQDHQHQPSGIINSKIIINKINGSQVKREAVAGEAEVL